MQTRPQGLSAGLPTLLRALLPQGGLREALLSSSAKRETNDVSFARSWEIKDSGEGALVHFDINTLGASSQYQ